MLPRIPAIFLLATALIVCQGCLQTLATAMLAPEALAVGGAAGGIQALTSTVSGEDITSLSDTAATARDLDRILARNPDAVNRPELEGLREQLAQEGMDSAAKRNVVAPVRGTDGDRLAPPEAEGASDHLVLAPRRRHGRGPADGPEPLLESTGLESWRPIQYPVSFAPVRVRP
jgi:hypothetical protein